MANPRRPLDVVFEPVMCSAAMRELDRVLRVVAVKDIAVTLVGKSGSGKEVLARRIHQLSDRRTGPFVPINCAAIPDSLFESELFGHERGAFTGANQRSLGKVEVANGGTLFLDELGEMPLAVQAKLLRFLEHRRFMRVGGTTKIDVDARLLCATSRPLDRDVASGRFRDDLFYRIQGVTLAVPPLRERRADIVPLVRQFVAELSARHSVTPPHLTRAALTRLQGYDWPGNVRELKSVIELCCLLRAGRPVRLEDLPAALQPAGSELAGDRALPNRAAASPRSLTISLDDPLARILRQVLEAALALEDGNRSRAARRLGISVRTIQRHLALEPQPAPERPGRDRP